MKKLMKRFLKDEQGLELSEYAVMIGLILLVVAAVIAAVGGQITRLFQALSDYLAQV